MNYKITNQANNQDLLKFFAITTMVIDHIGLFLYFDDWMRVIGRFAAPIFLFFVGYNYFRKKHSGLEFAFELSSYQKLFVLGIICEIITHLNIFGMVSMNILISISFGLFITDLIINFRINSYIAIIFLLAISKFTTKYIDYGTISSAFIYLGYLANFSRDKKFIFLTTLTILSISIFNYYNFSFSNIQNLSAIILMILCWYCMIKFDFEKKINNRIFIVSRYALLIYVVHYISFVILFTIIYT